MTGACDRLGDGRGTEPITDRNERIVYWKSRNEKWGLHLYRTDGWPRRKLMRTKTTATVIWPTEEHQSVTRGITWMNIMATITTPR